MKLVVIEIPRIKKIVKLLNEVYNVQNITPIVNHSGRPLPLVKNCNKFLAKWDEGTGKWELICSDYFVYFDEGFKENLKLLREEFKIKFYCIYLHNIMAFSIGKQDKTYVVQ